MTQFQIARRGRSWIVADAEGRIVSGHYVTWEEAYERMETLQNEARLTHRPCICCHTTFLSEGKHNRMCDRCRAKATAYYMAG